MADGSAPIIIPAGLIAPANEADVVLFAGGGGSSIAIEQALGKHPDAALNHWSLACRVHMKNYPDAEHWCADVMETDCRQVCAGRPVRLLWLSPDCRHFSPAKGSAPVSKSIRALAWAAIPWAKLRRPRVIILENVEAFLTWGPVIPDGKGGLKPDPARKGQTFERWLSRLRKAGYVVEWRIMSAADYGAPTIRKRLFLVARCDGQPIVWPAPTHAPIKLAAAKGLKPHRAAAEIIDFSRPCPSIFMTQAEAKARGLKVKRPLEEATLRRIAKGLFRYTIAHADPFIVPVTHRGDDRHHDIREPLRTITTADRGEFALIAPTILRTDFGGANGKGVNSPEDPLRSFTSAGGLGVAAAFITKLSENSTGHHPSEPLHTVMAGAPRHGLVAAHLVGTAFGDDRERAGLRAWSADEALRGIAASNDKAVVAAWVEQANTDRVGHDAREPISTVMTAGVRQRLVATFMEQANTDMVGHDAREPVSTIVQKGCTQRVIAAQLSQLRGTNQGAGDIGEPLRSPTAGGGHQALLETVLEHDQDMARPFDREGELRAFLVKYYGAATSEDLAAPLHSVTSRSRFGLVMVKGVAYRIVDIGMRMLDPETELAAAMGVPRRYVLGFTADGATVTKTDMTKLVGNMVSPPPARAIIAANLGAPVADRVAA